MATSDHQLESDEDLHVKLRANLEKFTRLRDDVMQEVDQMRRDTESVINLQTPSADDIESAQRILKAASIALRECYMKVCDCKKLDNSPSWDINQKLLDHNCQNFADELRKLELKLSIFAEQSKCQRELDSRINLKYLYLEDIIQLRNSLNQSENVRLELRINKMEQHFQKQLDGLSKELLDFKLSTSANQDKGNYSNLTIDLVNNKAGEKYATDIEAIRKNNQKEKGKLLNVTEQIKKMTATDKKMENRLTETDSRLAKLEQKFQDLESKTDVENNGQNVNDLNEKVQDNSHDIEQLWDMLNDRKAVEDNLFAEIDTIKHIQVDDEKDEVLSIGTVVGKLNFAMEALDVQIEKINDKLEDLHMKLHRGEEALSILTADAGLDSSMNKDDLAAAVREMGNKYMLMEDLVSKRVDHLEVLRRNLEVANKTVTRRKDLENEVAALKNSLSHLQTQVSTKDSCTRCQNVTEAAVTSTTTTGCKSVLGGSLDFLPATQKQESSLLNFFPTAKVSFGNLLNFAGSSTTTTAPRFTIPTKRLVRSSTTAVTLPSLNKAGSPTNVNSGKFSSRNVAGSSTTAPGFTFFTQSLAGSSATTAGFTFSTQSLAGLSTTAPAPGFTFSTQSLAGSSATTTGITFSAQSLAGSSTTAAAAFRFTTYPGFTFSTQSLAGSTTTTTSSPAVTFSSLN